MWDEIYRIRDPLYKKQLDIATKRMEMLIETTLCKYTENRAPILGLYGEYLFDSIETILWNLGYSSISDGVNSYKVYKHWRAPKYSSMGGIDRYIIITDSIGDIHKLAIECKNYAHYDYMSDSRIKQIYIDDILDRFKVCDGDEWKLLSMNKRNVHRFRSITEKDDIKIIPIEHHITPEIDRDGLKLTIYEFHKEMSKVLENIINDKKSVIKKLHMNGCSIETLSKVFNYTERHINNLVK